MQTPDVPADEQARLEALRSYEILDTLPEDSFDDLADLAATLCGVPMSLITFVDEDRQWNKACVGLPRDPVDREISFCGHVIANPEEPLIVEDTLEDDRFRDNPLVTDEPSFRFYAGVPVLSPSGHALGTVCVLDREPRQLSDEQIAGLETIADQIQDNLEDRKRHAQLLEHSKFLNSVIDSLHEHVAILDSAGTIVATNEAWDTFAERHGGQAGPGTDYQAASRPTDDGVAQRAHDGVEAVLDGEKDSFELEYPCHGPDERRWFRLTATGFEDAGRRFVVTAHRNITEAKIAEQEREELIAELAERDELLERLGRTLPQVLWIVEPDLSEVHFLGARAAEFWGIEKQTLMEDPMAWLDRLAEPDRERFPAWMDETVEDFREGRRQSSEFRFRYQLPDTDDVRWGRIQALAIHQEGEFTQVAGFTEDTTQAHRESALERQEARQKARLAELEQLVFATSHTLKTEVRRIRSFGQLLQSRAEAKTGDLDEPVEEMLEGSRRLEALHEGLREYAEVTQGDVAVKPVDLDDLAREALASRSDQIDAKGGQAAVEDLPIVRGDPEQLRRLFAELTDNAIKFAGDDPPRIRVEGATASDGVEVRFSDEGVGFDPAYADKVFEIFQQLEPAETEGVGIGLTIVQRIVENHGGQIRVEAAPGEGATFVFTLREDPEA